MTDTEQNNHKECPYEHIKVQPSKSRQETLQPVRESYSREGHIEVQVKDISSPPKPKQPIQDETAGQRRQQSRQELGEGPVQAEDMEMWLCPKNE